MHSISNLYLQGVPPGAPCSLSGVMSGNLRTVGMVVEDGPRLSGSCVSLESILRPLGHRRSRELPAPERHAHVGVVRPERRVMAM